MQLDDIIEEFLVESGENLDRLDLDLLELEQHPASDELIARVFRNIHTIKGTAGFFELPRLEGVAHAAENLLSLLRDRRLDMTDEITGVLLATVDALRSMLDAIRETGSDGTDDHAELVAVLEALSNGEPTEGLALAADPAPAAEPAQPVEPLGSVEHTEPVEPAPVAPAEGASTSVAVETSIRVDVGLLDRLMNLVGELVLARNQVLQHQSRLGDAALQSTSQQLDLITTELQEGVMKTRMQPIGNVWAKFPRVVRDLAAACGKEVRLVMEGEDTELDKTLIEAIKDPLTHIVRNSVDHGIEAPDRRRAAGKPDAGTLKLRAFHEGGQVIIEVIDDGGGLDLDRIREKAVAMGILAPDRAAQLTERESANLIFRPGFSTAAAVTNVSGRGVGMDVVKTNVEKIGGSLEVTSEPGVGTTLTIKIPLTLAIIPALIVTDGGDRYLIPQINLVEVIHVDGANVDSRMEMAGDAQVFRLRGKLLPIVHLRTVLGGGSVPGEERVGDAGDGDDGMSIAVLDADGMQFGLVVDQINDTEEIVVKPLSPHLKSIGCFAGTTIMGDGAVSLILDTVGIARLGGLTASCDEAPADAEEEDGGDPRRARTQLVLVCTVGEHRLGIPLAHVARLEELPSSSIERSGGADVIQYRDELLRLVHVKEALDGACGCERPELLQVLVHESDAGVYGLVVDEIVDVFEIEQRDPTGNPRAALSGVVGRRVTDFMDVEQLIAAAEASCPPLLIGAAS